MERVFFVEFLFFFLHSTTYYLPPSLSLEFGFCLPVPTRSISWKVSADSESNRTAPNVLLAPTFRQTFTFYQTTALHNGILQTVDCHRFLASCRLLERQQKLNVLLRRRKSTFAWD